MRLYLAGFVLLLVSAGVLLLSAVTRSLTGGWSWLSIACSVAAGALAVAGVVKSRT